jgi:hypothetical protein
LLALAAQLMESKAKMETAKDKEMHASQGLGAIDLGF